MPVRKIVIVGFGRVGGALALGLDRAGWPVTVFSRSDGALRRATALGLQIADHEAFEEADLCILAVPDDALAAATDQVLSDHLGPGTALVHCAGALDLTAFGTQALRSKRERGSFHPLVAVSDPEDRLEGHTVALSATNGTLLATLRKMAEDLSLHPIEVPEEKRAAYHAGAVMAAGGVVSLLSAAVAAFESAGVSRQDAVAALLPLSRSALRSVEQRGLEGGLTGPVRRGDVEVVRRHLESLPSELSDLYSLVSVRALALMGDQLPAEVREALRALLSTDRSRA